MIAALGVCKGPFQVFRVVLLCLCSIHVTAVYITGDAHLFMKCGRTLVFFSMPAGFLFMPLVVARNLFPND
jgi:hypothetical protein